MTRYTGGCLCGAVRYSVDAEPLPGRQLLCHCEKHNGTAFVSGMVFSSDAVAITGTMQRIGRTREIQGATQRVFLIGTRSANSIKASGHVYRDSGPNI